MLSCPPATTTLASPVRTAWAAMATARRPEPHSMLMLVAGTVYGTPALTLAWRAGFCPWPERAFKKLKTDKKMKKEFVHLKVAQCNKRLHPLFFIYFLLGSRLWMRVDKVHFFSMLGWHLFTQNYLTLRSSNANAHFWSSCLPQWISFWMSYGLIWQWEVHELGETEKGSS